MDDGAKALADMAADGWKGAIWARQEIARLRLALNEVAKMKPSVIAPGFQHGPALLLANCQRVARRALAPKKKATPK